MTPNRYGQKASDIKKNASKIRTGIKGAAPERQEIRVKPVAPKPNIGKKGPVYDVPKQPRRRTVKK